MAKKNPRKGPGRRMPDASSQTVEREKRFDDGGSSVEAETHLRDADYGLVSVLYHSLQGAETAGTYCNDAERDGDERLAEFFEDVQEEYTALAKRAKEILAERLRNDATGALDDESSE